MSSDPRVRIDIGDDGVATISLSHPPLNIYDLAMRDELIEAFAAVGDHPDVGAVVLAADGAHFSAGADLKEFGTARGVMAARSIRWRRDPWTPWWELPQPTVVALHGYALGAGLEMALLADVRVADAGTTLGLPETKLGMLPSAGGTQSLARVIGPGRAAPVVMLGETIDAAEATAIGIVDVLVDEDADGAAHEIAAQMARSPREATFLARRALRAAADLPLADGLRRERVLASAVSPDSHRDVTPLLASDRDENAAGGAVDPELEVAERVIPRSAASRTGVTPPRGRPLR